MWGVAKGCSDFTRDNGKVKLHNNRAAVSRRWGTPVETCSTSLFFAVMREIKICPHFPLEVGMFFISTLSETKKENSRQSISICYEFG